MSYSDLRGVVTFAPRITPTPRRGPRERSRFDTHFTKTARLLSKELELLGARDAVLEVDIPSGRFRLDGMPRADATAYSPGVRLSFRATRNPGKPVLTYESDHFTTWQDNVRAIALGLEALRMIDRYQIMEAGAQYIGQKALPAGAGESSMNISEASDFFSSYGVRANEEGYRTLLKRLHPDNPSTGSEAKFKLLQSAAEALSIKS